MLFTTPLPASNPLRDSITNAYRMDETECLNRLLPLTKLSDAELVRVKAIAKQLVLQTREYKKKQGKMDALLHEFDLSTEEGIALMCLAEALLRIPDKTTMDKFISDKLSTADWKNHLSREHSLFMNATTWALLLTGKIYAPTLSNQKSLGQSLIRAVSRLGVSVVRPTILQMMKALGKQFVMGENIASALQRAQPLEALGYRFSYDMLGEAARTAEEAQHYYAAYEEAITTIGASTTSDNLITNPSISVKLSALHPRYEYPKRERVLKELTPRLLALAQLAKKNRIALTIDAEEADRLDLSLDIFEAVFGDPSLAGWEGLGFVVQSYQKRASFVIDWLAALSKQHRKRIMVRLVKGAYWDAEIKISQVLGLAGYPVFTRKNSTDVSFLACAKKLLAQKDNFYPQFGTHNAYSVAAILEMTKTRSIEFEFQCLHGIGRPLYDQIVDKTQFNMPCRIYAPVGTHKDLLGYLVRRLLENGANTSFINQLADETFPIEKITTDPVARIASLKSLPHPKIPLPKDIYGKWQNSNGIDLSDRHQVSQLKKQMEAAEQENWVAASIVNGQILTEHRAHAVISPSHAGRIIGYVNEAQEWQIEEAIASAERATKTWGTTPLEERAAIIERAADLFQEAMPRLMTILTREGGKCIPDAISEVRETIDYCRYYAYRARQDLVPVTLPGPTGELNQIALYPRGIMACISPWNFPLAIFTGQLVASLVTGNTVIAKPAEQTPLIAFQAVQILHQAGVPAEALHLLIGPGSAVGAKLVADPRIGGVMFTGSTETAKFIQQTLAHRPGPIGLLVAETGGQNAMIVDSSALPEQVVIDIAQSSFNSAGQRCSALRVLFVQEEIAPRLLTMLKGYMAELTIGDPSLLATDIGPVIDAEALQMLQNHFAKMSQQAKLIAQVPMRESPGGFYFPPTVFELDDLSVLKGEVFGPILHVVRYKAHDLDKVMDAIASTGYGLTLGVHSRIEATINYITSRMHVGNMYVNRNVIGAVVGVQPFGGEGLSGTGPKAGGPHYLPRLCVERTISTNTTAVGGNARLVSLREDD